MENKGIYIFWEELLKKDFEIIVLLESIILEIIIFERIILFLFFSFQKRIIWEGIIKENEKFWKDFFFKMRLPCNNKRNVQYEKKNERRLALNNARILVLNNARRKKNTYRFMKSSL